jgi:hypothetical protein
MECIAGYGYSLTDAIRSFYSCLRFSIGDAILRYDEINNYYFIQTSNLRNILRYTVENGAYRVYIGIVGCNIHAPGLAGDISIKMTL